MLLGKKNNFKKVKHFSLTEMAWFITKIQLQVLAETLKPDMSVREFAIRYMSKQEVEKMLQGNIEWLQKESKEGKINYELQKN